MSTIDLQALIPNNVNLGENRQLQRALEHWQPAFLNWWDEMGPSDFKAKRGLPAHRRRRRRAGLGQLRLHADARLPLGHLPGRQGRGPQDRLRRLHGPGRLAGRARRIPLDLPPPDRDAGRHRAGIGRAAAPAGPHRAVAVRPAQPVPGERGGGPPPVGHGLPAARALRPRRPRRSRGTARAPQRRPRQAAHPGHVQRADGQLAVVLHVHLFHRSRRQVPAQVVRRSRRSIRWRAPRASC